MHDWREFQRNLSNFSVKTFYPMQVNSGKSKVNDKGINTFYGPFGPIFFVLFQR
jgi:hypothetical protein